MQEPIDLPPDVSHSQPLIVDAHAHIGRPDPAQVGPGFDPSKWRGHSHQDLLRVMDAGGIDVALLHTNDLWANAYHQDVVRAHPKRLFTVCKIDEPAAHTSGQLDMLTAYAQSTEFRGLYFDPWPPDVDAFANFHANRYGPFWRLVAELDLPICFVNYGARSPNLVSGLLQLLDRYPDFTITVVHGLHPAGKRPDGLLDDDGRVTLPPEVVRLVRNHDVYLEVLTGYVDGDFGPKDEVLAALFETFGARKLIWGSEFTKANSLPREVARSEGRYQEQFSYLERRCPYLSSADLALMRGGNARRIYGLEEFGPAA